VQQLTRHRASRGPSAAQELLVSQRCRRLLVTSGSPAELLNRSRYSLRRGLCGPSKPINGGADIHGYPQEKGKGTPYTITERRVPELIPVLGSQPAGDVSHKPGCRLPLLFAKPAVTPATLKRAATSFAA